MIRAAFIFVCGTACGALIYDTMAERAEVKSTKLRSAAPGITLDAPVMKADATVQHCTTTLKCGPVRSYYAGMIKKEGK